MASDFRSEGFGRRNNNILKKKRNIFFFNWHILLLETKARWKNSTVWIWLLGGLDSLLVEVLIFLCAYFQAFSLSCCFPSSSVRAWDHQTHLFHTVLSPPPQIPTSFSCTEPPVCCSDFPIPRALWSYSDFPLASTFFCDSFSLFSCPEWDPPPLVPTSASVSPKLVIF